MADDPKAGTATEEGGAASVSASPPEAGGEAGAQSGDRIAQLERQLAEINERYENEHRLRLAHLDKVERANQIIQQGGLPPTPDPLDQEIAELQAAVAERDEAIARAQSAGEQARARAAQEADARLAKAEQASKELNSQMARERNDGQEPSIASGIISNFLNCVVPTKESAKNHKG